MKRDFRFPLGLTEALAFFVIFPCCAVIVADAFTQEPAEAPLSPAGQAWVDATTVDPFYFTVAFCDYTSPTLTNAELGGLLRRMADTYQVEGITPAAAKAAWRNLDGEPATQALLIDSAHAAAAARSEWVMLERAADLEPFVSAP
jgi:hypothetical protein